MAGSQALPFDILVSFTRYLRPRDLLNLAATTQALHKALALEALKAALTQRPLEQIPKPIRYAIKHGHVERLSAALDLLDDIYPQGWPWRVLYSNGVSRILNLAADCNFVSLQYLAKRFPLWPESRPEHVPDSVMEHGFYATHITPEKDYDPTVANRQNRKLIQTAMSARKRDCVSFLLKSHEPPLFPGGFTLDWHPGYYSSSDMFEFILDDCGAILAPDALNNVACMPDVDPRVFDILIRKGWEIDAPREDHRDGPLGPALTPLHDACECLEPANVETLLRLGANPNGTADTCWIRKLPIVHWQYLTPSPMLTLLFSNIWAYMLRENICRQFLQCFQALIRYGASTSIPAGSIFDLILLRLWGDMGWRVLRLPNFTLPDCPDEPEDQYEDVQSLLLALEGTDISHWADIFEAVADENPMWRKKPDQTGNQEYFIQILREYQETFRDLPGPDQIRGPSTFAMPPRFGA
ncbi:hypothetical protein F4802DRAFT_572785 [Xylaria palmicola]|nr:hypothetical protein F4802DRAFT_572785 [Xylaria palmicola]